MLRWLKNKFKKTGNPMQSDSRSLFFHEDDFCQIQLLPVEDFRGTQSELNEAGSFAHDHFDGVGYDDIYVRRGGESGVGIRKIPIGELAGLLFQTGLPKAERVLTGYGVDFRVACKNTIGFGQDYSAIYFAHNAQFVEEIWLTNPFNIDKNSLIFFLVECFKRWDLFMADWEVRRTIDLSAAETISNYLNE